MLLCKELTKYNLDCDIISLKNTRNLLALPTLKYIKKIDAGVLVSHNPFHGLMGGYIAKKINKDVKKAQNISRLMPIPNVGKAPQFIEELFHAPVKESVGPVKLPQGVIIVSIEELNLIDAEKFNEEKDTFR